MANPNVSQIGSELKVRAGAIPPAVYAASQNSAGVDRLGYMSAVAILATGAMVGAGVTATLVVEHSDDNVTFTVYAQKATTTGANAVDRLDVDLLGAKRYVRTSVVIALNGGTSLACATALVLGGPVVRPVVD